MEVSKVFDTEKQIIRYDNLGIARPDLPAAHHGV